jgi:hypothetical protein
MSMRLALVIDGNAAGAKQALDETARGLANIKQAAIGAAAATGPALAVVAPAIDKASGALKGFEAELAKATGAINDMSAVGQRGLDQVRARFDPLFAAGQRYRQELADIREAMAAQALTQAQGAAAIARTKEAFAAQVAAINGVKGGMGAATAATKGLSFEAKNLSFQLVDITQGVLMGQSAFMILAQQGGQVAQVIGTSQGGLGGLMKELKASVLGLITPMRLLGLGAVAVGAAGYALYSSWKSSALALDDTARAAGTTIRVIRELQSVAAGKGIKADQFLPDMERFAAQVYQARNGMGGLADVLRANSVPAAKDFEDALGKAANLIARAKDDQTRLSLLQQMGLPATMEYVRFMQQGADGIRKARQEVVSFGGAAEDEMIRKAREFDEAWNRAWANFGNWSQKATLRAKSSIQDLLDDSTFKKFLDAWSRVAAIQSGGVAVRGGSEKALRGGVDLAIPLSYARGAQFQPLSVAGVRNAIGLGEKDVVDPEIGKAKISRELQALSLLGQTTTALESRRMIELQVAQAAANGVSIDSERVKVLTRLAEEQALGITQIKASADAQRLEADVIGMTVGQSTAYLAVQNAILDAKRRGQTLGQDEIAQIEREAAALGAAAQRTDNLKSSYDIAKGAFTTFRQEIAQGTGVWDALGKAGINALDKIGAKLGDLAFDQAWQMFFGSAGSAGGAGSGGIFASIGKLFGFARGGYTGDGGRQAVAGVVHGKEFVVNAQATARHRPLLEALNDNRLPGYESGGYVSPPPSNVVAFTGSSQSATSGPATAPNITFSIDARGAQKGVGEEVAETLAAFVKSPAFAKRVWDATKEGQFYRWS